MNLKIRSIPDYVLIDGSTPNGFSVIIQVYNLATYPVDNVDYSNVSVGCYDFLHDTLIHDLIYKVMAHRGSILIESSRKMPKNRSKSVKKGLKMGLFSYCAYPDKVVLQFVDMIVTSIRGYAVTTVFNHGISECFNHGYELLILHDSIIHDSLFKAYA